MLRATIDGEMYFAQQMFTSQANCRREVVDLHDAEP